MTRLTAILMAVWGAQRDNRRNPKRHNDLVAWPQGNKQVDLWSLITRFSIPRNFLLPADLFSPRENFLPDPHNILCFQGGRG